eukprot:GHVR01183594.1.p1 GENE.GHVR01183594.1~~GHVR01183594.1.p1  ORF type:complete len:253 (-),score=17.80 GHVR01183594.1:195-953(-)
MNNSILYLRHSPQRDQSDSCDKQLADLTTICKTLGLTVGQSFRDEDRSGADFDRPGLIAALKALKAGATLVVRNLDRIGRDTGFSVYVEGVIRQAGAKLYSHENGGFIDLYDHNALLIRLVNYWQAEKQRIEYAQRTSRRMRQHQNNGRMMSGKPPYGSREGPTETYTKLDKKTGKESQEDRRTLIKDAVEYKTVTRIITCRDNGYGYRSIAREFTNNDIPTRSGKPWSAKVVRTICQRWDEGEFYQQLKDA